MKHLARILSLALLVSGTLFIASCGGDGGDEPSEKEKQIDLLVGTWNSQSVMNEGDDYSDDYSNFQITIARSSSEAMTYVTAGRPAGKLSPWNANGTFTFGSNVGTDLRRGDNVDLKYSISGNTLTLTFENYPSDGGYNVPGRTETVEGDWTFVLTK